MAIIYLAKSILSKDNKKYFYIGRTGQTLTQRKEQHEFDARKNDPRSFPQALLRIGFENWEWLVLLEGDFTEKEAETKEKEFIKKFCEMEKNDPSIEILNESHAKKIKNDNSDDVNKNIIPKANRQKTYDKSEMGKKCLIASGKLKPVINLKTERRYDSVSQASKKDNVSICTIRLSSTTGKMLEDGTRYAYLDFDGNPILTDGHHLYHYIGKPARRVKDLISDKIYANALQAANYYGLSDGFISALAKGEYLTAKGAFVFCYLDENGKEIITPRHEKALEKIKSKDLTKYVAWPVDFTYEDAKENKLLGYFKTKDEICEKLKIRNKTHIKCVCDGARSHVDLWRIAYYDDATNEPKLTIMHSNKAKKVIRKVKCLNDEMTFNNYTEAGEYYSVNDEQIGKSAKGIQKSVYRKNKETGKKERLRFVDLDLNGNPMIKPKHKESLAVKGKHKIMRVRDAKVFNSPAEFCRETGLSHKRVRKFLQNPNINLLGNEFIVLD